MNTSSTTPMLYPVCGTYKGVTIDNQIDFQLSDVNKYEGFPHNGYFKKIIKHTKRN